MARVLDLARGHVILLLYLVMFAVLTIGVAAISGWQYLPWLGLFIGTLLGTYGILSLALGKRIGALMARFNLGNEGIIPLEWLCVTSVALAVLHLIWLGWNPFIAAMSSIDMNHIMGLRIRIAEESGMAWGYLMSFNVRAFLPLSLALCVYQRRERMFWLMLLAGTLYCISLLHKSYIFGFVLPSVILYLARREWLRASMLVGLMLGVIYLLMYAYNPSLRSKNFIALNLEEQELTPEMIEEMEHFGAAWDKRNFSFVIGLGSRLMYIPAKMLVGWFRNIPDRRPFLHGCGYRLAAKWMDCDYREYAKELYPFISPEYYARGYKGTVNTASFMYDYANFGLWGLVLAGILHALLFVVLESAFGADTVLKLALNLFYVLFLSSGAFTTLLLTGGWGIMVGAYALVRKE